MHVKNLCFILQTLERSQAAKEQSLCPSVLPASFQRFVMLQQCYCQRCLMNASFILFEILVTYFFHVRQHLECQLQYPFQTYCVQACICQENVQ